MILRRALVLGLCAAAIPWIQTRIDALREDSTAREDVLYFTSGEQLRHVLPGFTDVLADIYWLRTVQYYGGQLKFAKNKNYELLDPLVTITTSLDPHFTIAYRYGATFLCERYPGGAGRPDLGVALLEKGVKDNPDDWLLWQNLAFFAYFYAHDPARAAQAALEGGRRPGAPSWLATLAPELLRRGGDRQLAREMWARFAETSESGGMKETALRHLRVIDAADLVDALNARVARFRAAKGRAPQGWQEMRDAGYLRNEPRDPSGVPFEYDDKTAAFSVSRKSALWFPE
jgi:hypothetical protein